MVFLGADLLMHTSTNQGKYFPNHSLSQQGV